MIYSVIIPVYKNEASIPALLQTLTELNNELEDKMEAVFVVDGSPDNSYLLLQEALNTLNFRAQLLLHSRNFGSFPAIRSGLKVARGDYFGVLAADLQEPPELLITFFKALVQDECDIAVGTREARKDPFFSNLTSRIFWGLYRRLIIPEMPSGGVDVFGCNRKFRDQLLQLEESRSSLIALIFWLGYRRKCVSYKRQARVNGVSAWTLRKKIDYMMDSIFAFTDYPIRLLTRIGAIGSILSALLSIIIIIARLVGVIEVPGYTLIMLTVLFFGTLNLFGLGLIGNYIWRTYENSKHRPLAIVGFSHNNNREQLLNYELLHP